MKLTIGDLIQLKKQISVEETYEDFEHTKAIMSVVKSAEGLNYLEVGMNVLEEDVYSDDQRVATTRISLENLLSFYMKLLKEKNVWSNFIAGFSSHL